MRAAKLAQLCVYGSVLFCLAFTAVAQNSETFRTRLSPVPLDATMQSKVAGSGSVTAALQGSKLMITGTFEGLLSPATVAHLHRGPRGIPGPPILELTVSKAASGNIGGALDLNPAQVDDLRNGRVYVQLHSEGAPEGNLRGWLLK
jgi:hypothetical protein